MNQDHGLAITQNTHWLHVPLRLFSSHTIFMETQIYLDILLKQVYLDHLQVPIAFKDPMTHRCCRRITFRISLRSSSLCGAKRSIVKNFGYFNNEISHDLKSIVTHKIKTNACCPSPFQEWAKSN